MPPEPVSKDEFFEPLGIEKPVPAFLRSKVPIRNRNISKRDTEMLIRSIWSARAEYIRSEVETLTPKP
ncbi:hypothetical protein T484DRAFT_1776984 [Baffinella frigidus]|nr:hypothetical protein T484DRAFT_1776984 [Cryptophyta sp. CCMP2293]